MAIEGDSTVGGIAAAGLAVRRLGAAARAAALRGAAALVAAALRVVLRVAGRRGARAGAVVVAGRDAADRAIC